MDDLEMTHRTAWFDRILSMAMLGVFLLSLYQGYIMSKEMKHQAKAQQKEQQLVLDENRRIIEAQQRHEAETLNWMLQSVNTVRREQGQKPLPAPTYQAADNDIADNEADDQ